MRAKKNNEGPGALQLIEEAMHLLGKAPPSAWVIYLAGAVPWALGFGYFWAMATWFSPREEEVLWAALGLTALYVGLKTAQAEFCARVRAVRTGSVPASTTLRGVARTAWRQVKVQGWAAPLMPVAAVLALPLAVTWMFFENATALAATEDPVGETLASRSRREAMRWPWPAHLALLLLSGVWWCVWLNIASVFYVVPWLMRTLFGVENLFGVSGWVGLNSTFLALVTVLTWLAVDPLVKVYHVLRTFYGEARHTGEDLRLELRARPPGGAAARAVRVAVLLAAACAIGDLAPTSAGSLRAAEVNETTARVTPEQVDGALDEALRGRDFRWNLRPLPLPESEANEDGMIKRFARQGVEWVKQIATDIRDLVRRFTDWLDELFGGEKAKKKPKEKVKRESGGDGMALVRGLLYVLLGLCVVALVWVLWTSWRKRPVERRVFAATATAAMAPDLNDEKLEASRLPSHEWLELARSQLARGEWRLALRALYLASLASLGAQGLVTLARAKTNLDYERELARRAAGRDAVIRGFRERRLSFECVWYGRAAAEERQVRAWLSELEREEGGRP